MGDILIILFGRISAQCCQPEFLQLTFTVSMFRLGKRERPSRVSVSVSVNSLKVGRKLKCFTAGDGGGIKCNLFIEYWNFPTYFFSTKWSWNIIIIINIMNIINIIEIFFIFFVNNVSRNNLETKRQEWREQEKKEKPFHLMIVHQVVPFIFIFFPQPYCVCLCRCVVVRYLIKFTLKSSKCILSLSCLCVDIFSSFF